MRLLVRLLSIVTLIAVTAAVAWCFPTIYGDTGLVLIPTADVIKDATFNAAVNAIQVENTPTGNKKFLYPARICYGAVKNVEIAACLAQTSGGNTDVHVHGIAAKMSVMRACVDTRLPDVAFGVRAFQNNVTLGNPTFTSVYAVASKTLYQNQEYYDVATALPGEGHGTGTTFSYNPNLPQLIRIHVGASYDAYSGMEVAGIRQNAQFIIPFAGITVDNSAGSELVVDFVPKESNNGVLFQKATVSAAFRYALSPNFTLEVGETRPFASPTNSTGLYLGLNYHYNPHPDSVSY